MDFRQRADRLGHDDHLVVWHKPQPASWMGAEADAAINETVTIRELRVRLGMLAVGCGWGGITPMDDLFTATERRHGIHGGEIETSVMRHLHPDLVRMEGARNFVPLSVPLEAAGGLLTPEGRVGFDWMAQDLHPAGVSGNAAAADAGRGAHLVERAAAALVRPVREVSAFPLERLAEGPARP